MISSDRIHLSVAEARAHSERALRGIGYDAVEARIIADHAIDAALCGYEYSGLAKILNIPEHRRFKRPRYPMKVLRETEISTLYDTEQCRHAGDVSRNPGCDRKGGGSWPSHRRRDKQLDERAQRL